jgi:peptidoglycan/LPS O-acetylase OafA/YrhL
MVVADTVDETKKFNYIDALRGFAIIGVVMVHVGQLIAPSSYVIGAIVQAGRFGVQLFFVVSAFTLMMSLGSRRSVADKWVLEFFVRRFFRIAPAFYLGICFYTFIGESSPSYWAPNGVDTWQVVLTVAFLHGWHIESINAVVPGGWSIAAEAMFYLVLPWLYVVLKNARHTATLLLVSIVASAVTRIILKRVMQEFYPESQAYMIDGFLEYFFVSQIPVFLVGILTFQLVQGLRDYPKSSIVIMGYSLLILASAITAQTTGNMLPQGVLFSIGFSLLVLSLNERPIGLVVNPVTIFLGKISFSLYLVHFYVLDLVRVSGEFKALSGDIGFASGFLIVLAASAVVAFVVYRLVEVPGIALGKVVIGKIRRRELKNRDLSGN